MTVVPETNRNNKAVARPLPKRLGENEKLVNLFIFIGLDISMFYNIQKVSLDTPKLTSFRRLLNIILW
jgi:hypothetical protein